VRLTVFNGSPRTRRGNSEILVGDLKRGFTSVEGNSVEVCYLNNDKRRKEAAQAFAEAELIVIIFPLYVHAMPGIVMTWLEMLKPLNPAKKVKIGFIVQGGLPEARQSRFVERFLKRLPSRLGGEYIGTAIRGGLEAMQFAPAFIFRRMHLSFVKLGRSLATDGEFDPRVIAMLARTDVLPWYRRAFFHTLKALGIFDRPWDNQLKANGCWAERFDRPYAPRESDESP